MANMANIMSMIPIDPKRVAFRRRSHSLVRVAMAVVALVAMVAVTIAGFVAGPVSRESPPVLVVVMVVRVLVGSVGRVGIYKGLKPPHRW